MVNFYNPNNALSTNRPLTMIIGARGIGKTYSIKKYTINNFLKNSKKFVYLTRYNNDLKFLKSTAYDDVAPYFAEQGVTVVTKGLNIYVDDELAGEIMSVSQDTKIKKISRPETDLIVYDEFLQEIGSRYLPREPERLLSIASSIFRRRENCRIICMANTVEYVNPYFQFFGILPDRHKHFNLYDDICVEFPESSEYYNDSYEMTKFENLMSKTVYGDYALKGNFGDTDEQNLRQLDNFDRCQYVIVYEGNKYGVWLNGIDLLTVTLSTKIDPSVPQYAMSLEDQSTQAGYKAWYDSKLPTLLSKARNANLIFYDSIVTRKKAYKYLQKIGIY